MIRTNICIGKYSNIFEYPNIRHTLVYTLWSKLHRGPFRVQYENNFPHLNFFTIKLWLTNIRYVPPPLPMLCDLKTY